MVDGAERRDNRNRKRKRTKINSVLEIDFSLKSKDIAGKLAELYSIFLLGLYPLFLIHDKGLGISVRLLLYYAITISVLLAILMLAMEKKVTIRYPKTILDYVVILFIVIHIILIPIHLIKGQTGYELSLLVVALAVSFYLLSGGYSYYRYYTDIFLFAGAAVLIQLMVHYTAYPSYRTPIALLVEEGRVLAGCMLLLGMVSGAEFVRGKQRDNEFFYLLISGASFFFLFLSQNKVALLLGAFSVLVTPFCTNLTKEKVKRCGILAFLYFFLYSNMSLIASYGGILKIKTNFSLLGSIYLDMVLAAVGAIAFSYWDKISRENQSEEVWLEDVRKVLSTALRIGVVLVVVGLFGGKRITEGRQGELVTLLGDFCGQLQQEIFAGDNAFMEMLRQTGIMGLLLMAAIGVLLFRKLYACVIQKELEESKRWHAAIGVLVLMEMLFFPLNGVTVPMGIVFVADALYGKQELQGRIQRQENKG